MKLKAEQVFNATVVLTTIINQTRPLPQKGKYRIARLHAKLAPEFQILNAQRDALIKAYDHKVKVPANGPYGAPVETEQYGVPADKLEEFAAAWKAIADEEIEVDVQPVPLSQLDFNDGSNGSIQATEFIALGDLVFDDTAPIAKAA